jgi:SAM-dependent methyltransferase|uniref:Class I SAM-dependent methyltransferase n=1 Tax=Desulfobacca acetoxidans TaxID=60893 RepID=A0A7V6A405_9BACT
MAQLKQSQWYEQWQMFQDEELFLFQEWIYPNTLDDFRDKEVLEAGCGGGQHTQFLAPLAREITAVDLNTVELAKKRNKDFHNIQFLEADIAEMDLKKQFDIVFCVGVVHHTDNPEKTVENLKKHTKPGGKLILWVYSEEGNFLVQNIVEPFRKLFLENLSRRKLMMLSKSITFMIYLPIYTIYLLPLRFLPYYQYFENFRKLSFERNHLNVFDKLNAPQVDFINFKRITKWFSEEEFENIHISSYKNVSWRGSGTKRWPK